MLAFIFSTYMGTLTVKELCHDFACRVVKRFKTPCELTIQGNEAELLGIKLPIKQYMWGNLDGYEGSDNSHELVIFFKSRGPIYKAYVSEYMDRRTYHRWTCEFYRRQIY